MKLIIETSKLDKEAIRFLSSKTDLSIKQFKQKCKQYTYFTYGITTPRIFYSTRVRNFGFISVQETRSNFHAIWHTNSNEFITAIQTQLLLELL